ncbi:MAG: hypothetical protein GDA36_03605, partial [Rhodobacteraceae bacterium]|nr:hypothetical protein [Paracoccaceae bacterium]
MFGESLDLAILSAPLALPGLASGKAVLVVWLCDCRCLPVAGRCHAGFARLPTSSVGHLVLASPNYRAVRHRDIGIAQSRKRRLQISLPPRFLKPAGVDNEGVDDGRPTVRMIPSRWLTAHSIPVGLAGTGLV